MGWPVPELHQWVDTMALSASLALPLGLGNAAEGLDVEFKKDAQGTRLINICSKPNKDGTRNTPITHPEKFQQLYDYCLQDVRTEQSIYKALPIKRLPLMEELLWQLDYKINRRGMLLNRKLIKNCIKLKDQFQKELTEELPLITGGSVRTGKQVLEIGKWIRSKGIDLPDLSSGTVTQALLSDIPSDVRRVLEIRQGISLSSVDKFKKMLSAIGDDDRIRGTLQYHGANTGRWVGRLIQPHNLPKPKKGYGRAPLDIDLIEQCDLEALKLFWPDPLKVLSALVRPCIKASHGFELWKSDFSGIEARVLGWLTGCQMYQDAFRTNSDLYKVMASVVYRVHYDQVTDSQRFVGKCVVLACGYQMGASKFISTVEGFGVVVDSDLKTQLLNAHKSYRDQNKEITGYWYNIERLLVAAINSKRRKVYGLIKAFVEDDFLYIVLPSGRKLAYYQPRVKMRVPSWGGEHKPTIEVRQPGNKGSLQKKVLYGGLITENICQAIARDILAETIIRLEDNKFQVIFHVHDEIISEVPLGSDRSEKFKALMKHTPDWAKGIYLDADFMRTPYYVKG